MQRHGNIEVEGVIVANAAREEHGNKDGIIFESNPGWLSSQAMGEDESFDGNEGKLREGDKISGTRVIPGCRSAEEINKKRK